jgi:ABC-type transport system involved in cytochrome c biogenesis permease component
MEALVLVLILVPVLVPVLILCTGTITSTCTGTTVPPIKSDKLLSSRKILARMQRVTAVV